MKKYTGTNEVYAKPMILGEFIKKSGRNPYQNDGKMHANNEEGYLVKYEDGYESWSPKDVFDKAYHCTETYVDRLKLEYYNESEKLKKLSEFIGSEKFKNLPESKKKLLYIQQKIMKDFVFILIKRIGEECPQIVIVADVLSKGNPTKY